MNLSLRRPSPNHNQDLPNEEDLLFESNENENTPVLANSRAANEAELKIPWEERSLLPEQIVSLILHHAIALRVSDIYFSTNEKDVAVSVRHMGIVKFVTKLPQDVGVRCISHMRTNAQVRFGERRLPQDGRWVFRDHGGKSIDLRLNTMPTLFGESVAIRVFERDSELLNLNKIGFVGPQLGIMNSMLQANSGLILVTGPTGSGKTTTLYTCLHQLNDGRRKIHTIEDPIEYAVPGLHQTQVDAISISHGADFQEMLRGVIRQGPDVIMIGEVRDAATAQTAVRAANSGQLVFATLHAATAAAAVQSLLTFDVSPFFLCTSLLAVLGQRLMRRLDPATRVPIDLSHAPQVFDEVRPWMQMEEGGQAFAADPQAVNQGYRNRTGVFEIFTLSPSLRQAIMHHMSTGDIHQRAVESGMIDLRRAALLKVAHGESTFDEMQRVLPTGEAWSEA